MIIDYLYDNKRYKLIAVDLSKQQVIDPDPRATQQISFTKYLD